MFPQRRILVGKGDQALASGSFPGSAYNQINLADGQLGVLDFDKTGFVSGSITVQNYPSIYVVQGTPMSDKLSQVDRFGFTFPAYYESTLLEGGSVTMVSTTKPEVGRYNVRKMTITDTPLTDTAYHLHITLRNADINRVYDKTRRHTVPVSVTTPATAVAQPNDWVYQNLAVKANTRSIWGGGFERFLVLGVKSAAAGAAGTQLSTIADGTSIPFMVHAGTTYYFTADKDLVQTLQDLVTAGDMSATDDIVTLDTASAGTAASVDYLLFIGLDDQDYFVFDNTIFRKTWIDVGTDLEADIVELSAPKEWVGLGKHWNLIWKEQVGTRLYWNNIYGNFDEQSVDKLPNPVDENQLYTSTIIEFVKKDERTSSSNLITHQLTILLPAGINNPTAAVGAVTPPYTITTTDATTVTELNTNLGAWLASSDQISPIKYVGEASAGNPFV
ncbi:MAG: hypothetical protein D6711_10725 [Chloroflexi bacterium]|nr:MAG: hypothetical protein D6711_10725 [Chloroflexota bacterium]